MELLTTASKTSQVASSLRRAIKKGNYTPGSRLAGTRQLAQQFKVSPKTVKCALDVLQGERLVRCEHGRGVFVEAQGAEDEIDVYLLLWGMRREPCNYFEEILKLAYPPILKPGFSFTLRTVFKDSDDFAHFDQELARIENTPQIKCVLTSAAQFNLTHFEKLNKLSCPVVFFGESKYEEAADVPCNRIVDMAEWPAACVALLQRLQASEATLFIPDGSISFYREFTRLLVSHAGRAGIQLNLFEIPATVFGEPNQAMVREVYERHVRKAQVAGLLDCPVLVHGIIDPIFLELPEIKRRLQAGVPFLQPQLSSSYLDMFYDAVFDLIEAVVASPAEQQIRSICSPLLLRDLAEGEEYLFRDGLIGKTAAS
jgi:hypothetical protein